jgi:hypothetical protein
MKIYVFKVKKIHKNFLSCEVFEHVTLELLEIKNVSESLKIQHQKFHFPIYVTVCNILWLDLKTEYF